MSVFDDPLSITIDDPRHSVGESRFVTIGEGDLGKLLVVVHADHDEAIRVISARRPTVFERRVYEEG